MAGDVNRGMLLLGASGRLGGAIMSAAASAGKTVKALGWRDVGKTPEECRAQLASCGPNADVVFAGGLVDPGLAPAVLMEANADLPLRLIEAAWQLPGVRFLGIGSVLAARSILASGNPYLASKAKLAQGIDARAQLSGRARIMCLHTLYGGGAPKPHFFLGQVYASLVAGTPFRMSAGRQLREYHHVDDVARSVLAFTAREWDGPGVFNLSSAEPLRLADLARSIFAAFGRGDDLVIGTLTTPEGENEATVYPRSPDWLLGEPRKPVDGIVEWLGSCLKPRA